MCNMQIKMIIDFMIAITTKMVDEYGMILQF